MELVNLRYYESRNSYSLIKHKFILATVYAVLYKKVLLYEHL
jgi:hypothetical protein